MSLKQLLLEYVDNNDNRTLYLDSEILKQADMGDIFTIMILEHLDKCIIRLENEFKIGYYCYYSNYLCVYENMSNVIEIAILLTWINKCTYDKIYHKDKLVWNYQGWLIPIGEYTDIVEEFHFHKICKEHVKEDEEEYMNQILKLLKYNTEHRSLVAIKNHLRTNKT